MRTCRLLQGNRTKFFFRHNKKTKIPIHFHPLSPSTPSPLCTTASITKRTAFYRIHHRIICIFILTPEHTKRKRNRKKSRTQLQKVLSEFDFLHDLDHPQLQQPAYQQPRPAPAPTPSTPPILQQRPQIVFSADVYHRPVMSMPPVILMGGPVCDGGNSNYMHSSMPSSPIVEMPPSPAPSSMMYVDFPADEIDEVNMVQNIVEVRIESIFLFLLLCL